ncbi:MAG: cytochrome c [Saprospirales bacterium]|nr:MAG: cytochrome c [Saprospirales bacterium]
MSKFYPFLVLVFSLLLLAGCEYDTEEDLFPNSKCDTENVSYLSDILPILELNCIVCHSQSVAEAGIVLEGYDNLKFWVDNGRVQGSIKHEVGFSPMPPLGYELSDCEVNKILSWIELGAPEN